MNEWSLDVLYKGYDDEAFRNDFKKMDTLIQRCTQAADQLSHTDEPAALHTMQSYMPKFHAYLKRKAELLGYKNGLPWYELFAPLGEETKTYRGEEAKEYLLNRFLPTQRKGRRCLLC